RTAAPPPLPSFPTRRSSDLRAFRQAVGGRIRRRCPTHLHVGEIAALEVVVAELVETLARAGQHHHAGAFGYAYTRDQHERCRQKDRKSTRLNSSHDQISYAV